MTLINIITILTGGALGGGAGYVLAKRRRFIDIEKAKKEAETSLNKATTEKGEILQKSNVNVQNRKENLKQTTVKREERVEKIEESLKHKEELLKKREDRIKEQKLTVATEHEKLQNLQDAVKKIDSDILSTLTKKTNQEVGTLKETLLNKLEKELEAENLERLAKIEEQLKEEMGRHARDLTISAIHRLSSATSVETRIVTIKVSKDEIKGKIVGKDGQNIEELEKLLNINVVFNDLPNTISISAFQLVQRKIAQITLEKLCKTRGGIDKDVVRQCVKEAEKETNEELYKLGKDALEKMKIKNENKDFARIVGRLQYRTSYGQNIMKHSMEVGWTAAMIGSEIGANRDICRIAGFLHDLGKAIDQDPGIDKPHDYLSKELMEKYGFSWEEVHAAWTHHDAIPQETAEALIVKAADAISASRPGARQESFDKYIERMKALQEVAETYEGVKKAFTLSAGREVRVIVDPEVINDSALKLVAKDLATTIENKLSYPGQIKVNVIRRTKHTEIAQ